MSHTIKPFGEEGPEFPAKWEICGECKGEGHHVNPSVDVFTSDDLDEWYGDSDERYEFIENYKNGFYDIPCSECEGSGKVLVPDESRMTPAQVVELKEWRDELDDLIAMYQAERRAGA